MPRISRALPALCLIPLILAGCGGTSRWPGGTRLGGEPTWLAPGVVATGLATRDAAMTPDMDEFYFSVVTPRYVHGVICVTRREGGGWTEPEVVPFSGDPRWIDIEPAVAPDGRRLYFMSTRPAPGDTAVGDADLWFVDRQGDGWSAPTCVGPPVATEHGEFFPSLTTDGTLYFTRGDSTGRVDSIWRARPDGDGFGEPERLPAQVNGGTTRFNAWVAPDESHVILAIAGLEDGHGAADYYRVDRNADDSWGDPVNLGGMINEAKGRGWSPYVTPDGSAFVHMSAKLTVDLPWPATWSALQGARRGPGAGRASIALVDADVLETRPAPSPVDPCPVVPMDVPARSGPYAGTPYPGREPELFAPGFVSTGMQERDIVVHPGAGELWWGVMEGALVTVLSSRLEDGAWTDPVTVPFHRDRRFACLEPTLSADGGRVLFLSNRAAPGQEQGRGWANQNIFESRKVGGVWTDPVALPAPVTTEAAEYFPSLAADGTLYFTREGEGGSAIWAAEPEGDGFREPTLLPVTVNHGDRIYNGTVAPDESWLVTCAAGHDDNLGPADYWISWRDADGAWLPAVNMGPRFNGPGLRASSVALSPDGRHFFFSSNRLGEEELFPRGRITLPDLHRMHDAPGAGSSDLWWVDASVLDAFGP